MFTVAAVAAVLLAALLVWPAIRKLSHSEQVVAEYARAGVPERWLNVLAALLVAGAGGLIVGLFWAPVGIAAGIGLVLYFVGACTAHIRAGDQKNLPTPLVMLALSATTLILRAVTL